jgi:hypothetical protein
MKGLNLRVTRQRLFYFHKKTAKPPLSCFAVDCFADEKLFQGEKPRKVTQWKNKPKTKKHKNREDQKARKKRIERKTTKLF